MSNYKTWKDDIVVLEKLIRKHDSLEDLKEEAEAVFPDRSWSSVRSKIYRLDIVEKIEGGHIFLRKNNSSSGNQKKSRLTKDEKKVFKILKKEPTNLTYVSRELGLSKNGIVNLIDSMREKGYDVNMRTIKDGGKATYLLELERALKSSLTVKYEDDSISHTQIKFLIIGDTAFGLKAYQPELVATAFKKAEKENVDFAIFAGNITAGYATRSKRQDYYTSDIGEQIDFASRMPKVSFKTYFLNGQKDLKHKKKSGQNPGRMLAKRRENYFYVGDVEANFDIRGAKVKVIHGKEGSTYAKSYMIQGMKESLQGNVYYVNREEENPNLLIVAGVDTFMYLPAKKNEGMEVIGLPLLHAQTSSQKTRKRRSGSQSLGFTIVTVDLNEKGQAIPNTFNYEWFPLTHLQTPVGWRDDVDLRSKVLKPREKKVIKLLEGRPRRYGEISRQLDISKPKVKKIVRALKSKGYNISYDYSRGTISIPFSWADRDFEPFSVYKQETKTLKVASFSDTHIGNRDARLDLIEKVYKIAQQEDVDIITHSGDVFDGMQAYRAHEQEINLHGADEQRRKAEKIWPRTEIKTYIIAGSSHEWVYYQRAGHNVVKTFAKNIPNMEYIGGEKGLQGTRKFNGVKTKLYHPKGGLSYARSYKPQKFINNFIGEVEDVRDSVRLFLTGHLHVPFAMIYRGIASFLVPCLEEQTWYLKGKGLFPYLGMWITTIVLDKHNNIIYLKPRYIAFDSQKDNNN